MQLLWYIRCRPGGVVQCLRVLKRDARRATRMSKAEPVDVVLVGFGFVTAAVFPAQQLAIELRQAAHIGRIQHNLDVGWRCQV